MYDPKSPMWRVRRDSPEELGTTIFVAAGLGKTYQNTGTLRLTQKEHDVLEAKLTGKEPAPAPDLNAEEYNQLMEFLLEWSVQDLTALHLAEMVRRKFGASIRRTGSVVLEAHEELPGG